VIRLEHRLLDAAKLAQFWADVLSRRWAPSPRRLRHDRRGESTAGASTDVPQVPSKEVKNRLHLD